ncbi:uncharacterized protein BX664DRAFT_322910 [Halteromyces radiatus]|uniref:uncharacterized protein n=1 Tax=Halteromyces radiatus TaxID=101107 RepID=UPI002220FB9E|nr:uncharacterized protein BX664DRAFT_322910 [Halteromyces radiatus]KAI8100116.1 hypothetical protein BX664DRAFT_322910 [Halteromyces radiatus]
MKIPEQPTPNLVIVKNIGKDTSQVTLENFFAFCGKISDIELQEDGDQQKALILFESSKAAKTAELLSNALVENNHIQVEPYFETTKEKVSSSESEGTESKKEKQGEEEEEQTSKPVSNIMAELLASGYLLGDQVLAKGIEFDHKFGVREKVQHYFDQIRENLQQWNQQYHVSDRANEMEQRMGLQQKQKEASEKAQDWLQHSPAGQKVAGLVSQFSQQISDLHHEAIRLKLIKQGEAQSKSGTS